MITLSKSKLLKFAELSELQIDGRSEFAYTNRLEHFAELVLSDLDVCMEHVPENEEPRQQLTARVRELEEENAWLKAESRDACLGLSDYYSRKLAAEQLNNKQLREALKMVTNKVCWSVFTDSEETQIEEALAQPFDTSALDAYVAEKVEEAIK